MTITVACMRCAHRKRPLQPCPSCHAPAPADYDMTAWRLALHAHHLARITADPIAPAVRLRRPQRRPLRVVVSLDTDRGSTASRLDLDATLPAAAPLSFDWSEEPPPDRGLLRLRRSA